MMSIVKLLKIDGVSTPLDVGLAFGEPALSWRGSGQLRPGLPCLPPAEADSLKFRWRLPALPAPEGRHAPEGGHAESMAHRKVRFKEG
jgi:hypothetical protein